MSSDLQNDLHFSDVYLKTEFNFSDVHEEMNNKGSVPFTVNLEISSRNVEISLSLTDVCFSCLIREFETWQICLLTQFAKIKFSQKYKVNDNRGGLFVCFDALHPSQQFFSNVELISWLPELTQHFTANKCLAHQHNAVPQGHDISFEVNQSHSVFMNVQNLGSSLKHFIGLDKQSF